MSHQHRLSVFRVLRDGEQQQAQAQAQAQTQRRPGLTLRTTGKQGPKATAAGLFGKTVEDVMLVEASPLEEEVRVEIGLAQVSFNMVLFAGEAYIFQLDRKVQGMDGREVFQREVHCVAATLELAGLAADRAMRLVEFFNGRRGMEGWETVYHMEVMGRESKQFMSYFHNRVNFLIYFAGIQADSFNEVRRANIYRPRLLRIHSGRQIARVFEVPRSMDLLEVKDAFVLDLGSRAYTYQKDNDMRLILQATLVIDSFENERRRKVAKLDFDMSAFQRDLENPKRPMPTGTVFANIIESSQEVNEPVKELWRLGVAENAQEITTKDLKQISEGRISRLKIPDNDEDGVYIVDDEGKELFLYKSQSSSLSQVLMMAQAYCSGRENRSVPISLTHISNDIVCEWFDKQFVF